MLFQHDGFKPRVSRLGKIGILFDHLTGVTSRHLQQLHILGNAGQTKRRKPVLSGSENLGGKTAAKISSGTAFSSSRLLVRGDRS